MGIKRNLAYSSFLSLSNYLFGFIVYPYVTRILGVDYYGTVDFVVNIVAYALLFSSFGLSILGIREIAKVKNDKINLNKCYSSLLSLNLIYTLITLIIYAVAVCVVDKLSDLKLLFILGSVEILSTTFLTEWLFRGLEDFRYITLRNFIIKIIYIIAVFVFVKEKDDYIIYYALVVSSYLINAIVNTVYSRRFVKFSFKDISLKSYAKSSISLGSYMVLTSMYTTFNVAFLGFVSNTTQVGLYAAALKLYVIFLGLYTAFTSVMMPRGASLIAEKRINEYELLLKKSFEALYTICFPLMIGCTIMASEIINVIAGKEFVGAVPIMRIIMPLLLIVGMAQILARQVVIPNSKDKIILVAAVIGAIIGVSLNILFVTKYAAIGTAMTLVCTELSVTLFYLVYVLRTKMITIDVKLLLKHVLFSTPYMVICMMCINIDTVPYIRLGICMLICLLYFIIEHIYLLKTELVLGIVNKFKR